MKSTDTMRGDKPIGISPGFSAAKPVGMNRRQLNALLLLGAINGLPTAARAQPAEAAFLVHDFEWVDTSRTRPVPARLYWPAASASAGSVPLVIFSHGIGGSRKGYSYLGKHWSARGVASLHVQHVGSDAALWAGNPFGIVGRLQAAAQEKEALARAADVRFALDRMLSDENASFGAFIDRQRIVAAGHSYGANTTLLTIGAQVIREGRTVECLDARFSAAAVISAPPFYGERDLAQVLNRVSVPTMHVTATQDVIEIPGYRSGAADRLAIFDAISNPHKLLAVFRGGSHSIFTDRTLTGGLALNAKVKTATADLALAFFDLVFDGNGRALTQWDTDWQSILERSPVNAHAAMPRMTDHRELAGSAVS